MGRAARVVIPLLVDVVVNPRQIFRAEADHAVSGLPCKALLIQNALIEVVGAGAFESADPVADLHRRRDRYGQMDVVVSSTHSVADGPGRFLYALFKKLIEVMLDGIVNQLFAPLRMPRKVEVDLRLDVFRHSRFMAQAVFR